MPYNDLSDENTTSFRFFRSAASNVVFCRKLHAHDFELPRLVVSGDDNRETIRLSDLRGKTVILNFWATWCGPCLKKMPEIVALYDRTKDNPTIVLIGISLDEDDATAIEFLKKRTSSWSWIQLRANWPSPR